ncbi:MAG: hypothetical protein HY506_02145 [Candidatus Yanofskybacteria bacterium]|nr:hypothetical protein [Candidatus Yanofskybacteria bacterium]
MMSSWYLFGALQALDIILTLVGMSFGAVEGMPLMNRLMSFMESPIIGMLAGKILCILFAAIVWLHFKKTWFLKPLNYWYVVLAVWNVAIIYIQFRRL